MGNRIDEESQRVLVLLKLDAKRVFERIRDRRAEYMYIFSVKRTREHFKAIFYSRYFDVPISQLVHCGQEVIVGLDQFYSLVEELRWYLNHTEDMPSTVEDKVNSFVKRLATVYDLLNLYINAELEIGEAPEDNFSKQELLESIDNNEDLFGDSSDENIDL